MPSSAAATGTRLDKTMLAVMLAGACTFLNVYCTQPLLPYLQRVFQATELQVSLTVSATIFAVALLAPFVGVLAERRGRKRVIAPFAVPSDAAHGTGGDRNHAARVDRVALPARRVRARRDCRHARVHQRGVGGPRRRTRHGVLRHRHRGGGILRRVHYRVG